MRATCIACLAAAASWLAAAPCEAEESAHSEGTAATESSAEERDGEERDGALPAAAALRRHLAEPVGDLPAPWVALSAVVDGGSRIDGDEGWMALRVHVPVARRYGAVDARLRLALDADGFVGIDPEFWLRAIPVRLVDGGRGAFGVALGVAPSMDGPVPLLTLTGGIMGGFLGESWFARGFLGVRGEVLELTEPLEILVTAAAGLRLLRGQLRPQLEVDLVAPAEENAEVSLALRPAFRYWPAEWIGIGVSGDAWVLGPASPWGAVRLDVVFQALE